MFSVREKRPEEQACGTGKKKEKKDAKSLQEKIRREIRGGRKKMTIRRKGQSEDSRATSKQKHERCPEKKRKRSNPVSKPQKSWNGRSKPPATRRPEEAGSRNPLKKQCEEGHHALEKDKKKGRKQKGVS